jgi:tetratricopeptide (TPR) repeat protein
MIELAWASFEIDPARAVAQLAESAKRLSNSDDAARVAVERVRLSLLAGDNGGTATALASVAGDAGGPGSAAAGWLAYGRGLVAAQRGETQQARTAWVAAAQGRPLFVEPQAALAELNLKGPALVAKLTALGKRGGSGLASWRAAQTLMRMGKAVPAAALFDRVLWTDPTVAAPRELLSSWMEALDRAGQKERVAAMVQAMHTSLPNDDLPLRLMIGRAERAGKTADAVEAWRALLAAAPDDTARKIAVARALINDGKPLDAEPLLTQIQRDQPNVKNPELTLELGRAWAQRDPVRARILMQDAIAMAPRAMSYAALGDLEARLGRTDEATAAFHKALDLEPNLVELRYGLVRIMNQKRAFGEAAAELRRLVAADPQDVRAREMLGDTLLELNDAKAAAVAFQGAIDAGGDNPGVLMKLARTQMEQLDLVGPAVKTLRRVVKLNAKLGDAHYYLGLGLKDLGKASEAKTELKSYLSLAPKGEFVKDAQRLVDDLERTP